MCPEGKGVDGVRIIDTGDVCVCNCTGRKETHLIGDGTHDKSTTECVSRLNGAISGYKRRAVPLFPGEMMVSMLIIR